MDGAQDHLEGVSERVAALGGAFARKHEHHERTASTNDRLVEWRREPDGAEHGACVTAESQTKGRGRMGRVWVSEGRDIYASVLLLPGPPKESMGALGLAVGLALAEGIEAACRGKVDVRLKWPNDLCVLTGPERDQRRKLGGILVETRWLGREPEIVVGFGINVGREHFEGELAELATSMQRELGDGRPGRREILAHCLRRLEQVCDRFFAGGFPSIRRDYMERCISLGADVWVPRKRPDGSEVRILARVITLEEDGALRVESAAGGPAFRVESADVWMERPVDDRNGPC
jgi:BirA family biotin operon repressor/biotin-[acetyl-CoA-carboxylase] ligase